MFASAVRRATIAAPASELQFEVGTGELGPGARFLPHGHVVLINVVGIM
jgi:hypothetical protein